MKIKITRKHSKTADMGTLGTLSIDGKDFCQTLELPWLDNKENVSCIPAGEYKAKRTNSPHHGNVFEITNVPSRTHVLIHKANFLHDLLGCVGLGMISGEANGQYCVYKSKEAFDAFMQATSCVDEFDLSIVWA